MKKEPSLSRNYVKALKGSVDVSRLLNSYGVDVLVCGDGYIRSSCIVHGGSNVTSLSYSMKTGMFKCFGECGFVGDVIALIRQVDGCSFKQAVEKAASFAGNVVIGAVEAKEEPVEDWIEALSRAYSPKQSNDKISTALVDRALMTKPNPYVVSGKFLESTIDYFEVGYCDFNEYFMDRAIITIHDETGTLVGYSGRSMKESGAAANKYRIKKGFRKGWVLYNLNRASKYLNPRNPMVIVEGFGQVWRLHEAGVDSVVALMGKDATDEQVDLILKYTTSVVLGLDFDEAGIIATKKLIDTFDGRIDIRVMQTTFSKNVDLGDMSTANALKCYDLAIPDYLWVNTVYRDFIESKKEN